MSWYRSLIDFGEYPYVVELGSVDFHVDEITAFVDVAEHSLHPHIVRIEIPDHMRRDDLLDACKRIVAALEPTPTEGTTT